jgi:hypothetical protein
MEQETDPQESVERPDAVERPDPVRLRYWAWLIKLLRDPWPPRVNEPARYPPPPARVPPPPRQPEPPRIEDA